MPYFIIQSSWRRSRSGHFEGNEVKLRTIDYILEDSDSPNVSRPKQKTVSGLFGSAPIRYLRQSADVAFCFQMNCWTTSGRSQLKLQVSQHQLAFLFPKAFRDAYNPCGDRGAIYNASISGIQTYIRRISTLPTEHALSLPVYGQKFVSN